MRFEKRYILLGLVVLGLSISLGCSKKEGESTAPSTQKTPAPTPASAPAPTPTVSADVGKPVSEVQAQAETMSVEALKAMAIKYKEAIAAKQAEVEKVLTKVKEIPITEALGQEAKTLKTDVQNLQTSLQALKDRFQVYYETLKKKGADLSGLTS